MVVHLLENPASREGHDRGGAHSGLDGNGSQAFWAIYSAKIMEASAHSYGICVLLGITMRTASSLGFHRASPYASANVLGIRDNDVHAVATRPGT